MGRQRHGESTSKSTAMWIDEYVKQQFARADPAGSSPRLLERLEAGCDDLAGTDRSAVNNCESFSED